MTAGSLVGRVALVSGASRGQGAAIAKRFAAEGAAVVVGDILEAAGHEVVSAIGGAAHYVALDVTSEEQWKSAVSTAVERFGGLDILVNNAGMIKYAPIADTSLEDYVRHVEVDQIGAFLGMRSVYSSMVARGGGAIINTSSTAGILGLEAMGAYSAAKQAVRAMTRVAACEWGSVGIRVNTIIPGAIRTSMLTDYLDANGLDTVAAACPLNRVGEPEDIANLALFLASDESAFCTGSDFYCDGGMAIFRPQ